MQIQFLSNIEALYAKSFSEHGVSSEGLWCKQDLHALRLKRAGDLIARYSPNTPDISVFDIGCGFADLYPLVGQRRYVGLDPTPGFAEAAREKHGIDSVYPIDMGTWGHHSDVVTCLGVASHLRQSDWNMALFLRKLVRFSETLMIVELHDRGKYRGQFSSWDLDTVFDLIELVSEDRLVEINSESSEGDSAVTIAVSLKGTFHV